MLATPAATPSFTHEVRQVTRADVRLSWHRGCPVGPANLRLIRLGYWGFDGKPHVGAVVVNFAVVDEVSKVFEQLYNAHFPIRRMQPIEAYGGSGTRSAEADNTSAFDCRRSGRAAGRGIDINPVENPRVVRGVATPFAGRKYLNRAKVRLGMAVSGGLLVQAFAQVGWSWAGRVVPRDYAHFSANGR
jgi:hypothetical protein